MPDFKAISKATVDRLCAEGKVKPSEVETIRAVIERELIRDWAGRRVTRLANRQIEPILRRVVETLGRTLGTVVEETARAGRK